MTQKHDNINLSFNDNDSSGLVPELNSPLIKDLSAEDLAKDPSLFVQGGQLPRSDQAPMAKPAPPLVVTQDDTQPQTQVPAQPAAQSVIQPAAKPAAQPTIQPAAQPLTQSPIELPAQAPVLQPQIPQTPLVQPPAAPEAMAPVEHQVPLSKATTEDTLGKTLTGAEKSTGSTPALKPKSSQKSKATGAKTKGASTNSKTTAKVGSAARSASLKSSTASKSKGGVKTALANKESNIRKIAIIVLIGINALVLVFLALWYITSLGGASEYSKDPQSIIGEYVPEQGEGHIGLYSYDTTFSVLSFANYRDSLQIVNTAALKEIDNNKYKTVRGETLLYDKLIVERVIKICNSWVDYRSSGDDTVFDSVIADSPATNQISEWGKGQAVTFTQLVFGEIKRVDRDYFIIVEAKYNLSGAGRSEARDDVLVFKLRGEGDTMKVYDMERLAFTLPATVDAPASITPTDVTGTTDTDGTTDTTGASDAANASDVSAVEPS